MLERLTKELWNGCPVEEWSHFIELDGNEAKVIGEGWANPVVVGNAIERLAAYEDTGLTPERIRELQNAFNILFESERQKQQENKQLQAQNGAMWEALAKAGAALELSKIHIKSCFSTTHRTIDKALAAIDKIGGREDV